MPETWLIVGASRGIGLEFARQLLARGHTVIATARAPITESKLWKLNEDLHDAKLRVLECDVSDERSIKGFAGKVKALAAEGTVIMGGVIDSVVINAGILDYPGRISEM